MEQMAIALSILSAVLIGCIMYIIQSAEKNFSRRQETLHAKLNEMHTTMIDLVTRVARMEGQNDLAKFLHGMEERVRRAEERSHD